MKYKNGREANEGDGVVIAKTGYTGFLHGIDGAKDRDNCRIGVNREEKQPNDVIATVSELLHVEDVEKA